MTAEAFLADTIGESTYRRLRGDIIFGRLPPERKLRLEQLRGLYDVSIATLREVLPRLVAEGLILFETQKGFEVAPVSATDLREIAEMRTLLECHAVAASFAAGDLEWEAGVVAAHHKLARMEARMLAGDRSITATWKRYDREFHLALIAACGSAELLAVHQRIFDRFPHLTKERSDRFGMLSQHKVQAAYDAGKIQPDLVPVAMEVFDRLMPQPNQLGKLREDVSIGREQLLEVAKTLFARHGFHGVRLDDLAKGDRRGQPVSLRWILSHLVEEYARHLGHMDLLREAVDGRTGY